MSVPVVTWEPNMRPLGEIVVAMGVFDGVHLGHQSLLGAAAREARRRGVRSVALTFDRDPDQIVTPDEASPQLLTLDDKVRFIGECGIDLVLIVPFTAEVARITAEDFLDLVLGSIGRVLSVHVGENFRFGARALGDVDMLYGWESEHGDVAVEAHDLVRIEGVPVTSTRIRGLIADGDIAAARVLLGRYPRLTGDVVHGRGEGAKLGVPTANVTPVRYAAVPADGVYAGRAILPNHSVWPAAISVGTPPTFPEARDYVEVHVLGFNGDLYDQRLTVEFVSHIRDQRAFGSLAELTAAIHADIEQARGILGSEERGLPYSGRAEAVEVSDLLYDTDYLEDGTPVISDPDALAAAEAAAMIAVPPEDLMAREEDWIQIASAIATSQLGDLAHVHDELAKQGVPVAFEPYDPRSRVDAGYGSSSFALSVKGARAFRLYVAPDYVRDASALARAFHLPR